MKLITSIVGTIFISGLFFNILSISASQITVTAVVKQREVVEPVSTPEAPQLSITADEVYQPLRVESQQNLLGIEL